MILEMHDICKDYPMGKSVNHILKHIDLEVEEGEYLAIMGPSASCLGLHLVMSCPFSR